MGWRHPTPPPGCVVSFTAYHLRGLGMPMHRFLCRMLHHYGVPLHALSPNGVYHMDTFMALCDGFLGTHAHFNLFAFFFKAWLVKTGSIVSLMGYWSIQRKYSQVPQYPQFDIRSPTKIGTGSGSI